MKPFAMGIIAALVCCAGCGGNDAPSQGAAPPRTGAPAGDQKSPKLDDAVSQLKSGLKDAAEVAKSKMTVDAEAEIDRISKQLYDVADSFAKNAGSLQGDAKSNYDKVRITYEEKKAVFEQKLKEFKEGSAGAKAELLKGLFDALADMKSALDHAAEAFKQPAGAVPSETKPS